MLSGQIGRYFLDCKDFWFLMLGRPKQHTASKTTKSRYLIQRRGKCTTDPARYPGAYQTFFFLNAKDPCISYGKTQSRPPVPSPVPYVPSQSCKTPSLQAACQFSLIVYFFFACSCASSSSFSSTFFSGLLLALQLSPPVMEAWPCKGTCVCALLVIVEMRLRLFKAAAAAPAPAAPAPAPVPLPLLRPLQPFGLLTPLPTPKRSSKSNAASP